MRRRRSWLGLMVVLAVGLPGAGTAWATTVSRPPDLTATVTATVKPTRLPADDTAPVTLGIEGTMSRRPTCLGECPEVRAIEVRLDPQIAVDTEGLPICHVADVKGSVPSNARRKCGAALIGSGDTTETVQFVETPAFTRTSEHLFFNAGKGRVLMYNYLHQTGSSGAGLVGTIRHLTLHTGGDASEVSFQLTFGKRWRSQGKHHSYLRGKCRTGTLKQQVKLTLSDGSSTSDVTPQRCTKRTS